MNRYKYNDGFIKAPFAQVYRHLTQPQIYGQILEVSEAGLHKVALGEIIEGKFKRYSEIRNTMSDTATYDNYDIFKRWYEPV